MERTNAKGAKLTQRAAMLVVAGAGPCGFR